MDLSRPVAYRGLALNDAVPAIGSGRITGNLIDDVSIGAVNGVGYSEKRSMADGRDVSDVFLDGRRIVMSGTVYGTDLADTHDRFQQLRSILTPTAAFSDEPGAYGYLPLSWDEPTGDTRFLADPGGVIRYRHLYANVRPMASPELRVNRDRSGGRPTLGSGFPFQVVFDAKDPRLYIAPEVMADYTDNTTGQAGNWVNRGDYPAPLNVLLITAPHSAKDGQFTLVAGGSTMNIILAKSVNQSIYRYDGTLKILTVEENAIEVLRMDLLVFPAENTHPLIQPNPPVPAGSSSPWSISTVITVDATHQVVPLLANSRMWFNEAYA